MAKLVYSTSVIKRNVANVTVATYTNADYVIVKAPGSNTVSSSNTGIASYMGTTEGIKIMKGCAGCANLYAYYVPNRGDSSYDFILIKITYNNNGTVVFGDETTSSEWYAYCHLEFYKQ